MLLGCSVHIGTLNQDSGEGTPGKGANQRRPWLGGWQGTRGALMRLPAPGPDGAQRYRFVACAVQISAAAASYLGCSQASQTQSAPLGMSVAAPDVDVLRAETWFG